MSILKTINLTHPDATANTISLTSDRKVGIGTTSPDGALDVTGANGGNGEIYVQRTSGATLRTQAQSALGVFGTTTNHNLSFITNNGGRMTIDTNGRVGIGTTSPSTTLHLSSAGTALRLQDTDTNAYAEISTSDQGALVLEADKGNGQASTTMLFKVDGTERMRITSAGAVSISSSGYVKTNSPQYLTIGDGASSTGAGLEIIRGEAISGGTGPIIKMYHGPDSGTQVEHRISSYVGDLLISADHGNTHSGTTIDFYLDGSRRVLLNSSGQFVFDQSGAGLKFNGRSTVFDDYEEGTFTPSLEGGTTAGSFTYSYRNGWYTKVGNIVTVHINIDAAVATTPTGTLLVTGLPFTCVDESVGSFQCNDMGSNYQTNVGQYTAIIQSGNTNMHFRGTKTDGSAHATMQAQSMSYLRTTITYKTS